MIDPVLGWVNGKPRLRKLTAEECAMLIQQLTHRKARRRWIAADLLGKQRVHESIDTLVRTLHDPHWLVRLHAAKALGRIGDTRAFTPLCVMLRDDHASVRRRAVIALGQLRDERVIPEVLRILQQDRTLWREVAESLANFVTPRAAYTLMRAATQPHQQPSKHSIIEPLGHHLTPLLILLLKYRAESWQSTIVRWLGRLGDGGAIPILRTLSTDARTSMGRAAYAALDDVQYRQYQHLVPKATTTETVHM